MGNKIMHQTPFIVKAVNMHDDLISVVKEARDILTILKTSNEFSNLTQYGINNCLIQIKKLLIREENADE